VTGSGHGLWRSAGLRLAALSGFLVLLAMLAALALVYIQVSSVLHRNVDRQLLQTQQRLALQYAHEGPEATAQAIHRVLHDGRDTDLELVLLTTPDGRFLAGNIDVESLPPLRTTGATVQQLALGTQTVDAQLLAHPLPDGALLVLGHDLRELRRIESTVATASVVAGLFSGSCGASWAAA
jgi:Tfp pilus assembly protein PilN